MFYWLGSVLDSFFTANVFFYGEEPDAHVAFVARPDGPYGVTSLVVILLAMSAGFGWAHTQGPTMGEHCPVPGRHAKTAAFHRVRSDTTR